MSAEAATVSRPNALHLTVCSIDFQNPIVLAAGTAAYGREISEVTRLESLGGIVTKAVSVEPRSGAPSPRVAEYPGGMLNAIGLANPGVHAVKREHLPWLATLERCRVMVNVVGSEVEHFAAVVAELDSESGFQAYELNLSCPNVKAGGLEFGADPVALKRVVELCRAATSKPLSVKLSPILPELARSAGVSHDAGADMISLLNTVPGMLIDVSTRRPRLGFGTGGVSGAALLPVGVLAVARVTRAVPIPVIGIGGVSEADHALQYILAGAHLVGVGTAQLRDPRAAERIVRDLASWCATTGITSIADVRGTLEWSPK